MLHTRCRFVLQVLGQIDNSESFFHICSSKLLDPRRNGSREQAHLEGLFVANVSDGLQYFVNIFFESKLQHHVCFVEDQRFEARKVDISPFDVVEDSSCCSNKNVNSLSELANLIFNVDTSIDCDNSELAIVVLQLAHLVSDL